MRMLPEHFEEIKVAVSALDTPAMRDRYLKAHQSDMRYRWDLLWQSKQTRFVSETLYQYLNDDHIDTALRKIVPPLRSNNEC